MAKIGINGLDDVKKMFDILEDPSQMAIKVINENAPILEKALKDAINTNTQNGTGELARSISTTPAKENDMGIFAVVRPVGTDSDGNDMADRLRWLDTGRHVTKNGKGYWLKGKGVRQKAVNAAQLRIEKTIEKSVNEWANKAGGG